MQETYNNPKTQTQGVIDIRELIVKYLKKWHWFAVSIALCLGAALLYYFSTTPKYVVSSTIMINTTEEGFGNMIPSSLSSIIDIGGESGNVEDELEILNSRFIMRQAITNTNTQTEYRYKKGLRWVEQYPQPFVEVIYEPFFIDTTRWNVKMELKCKRDKYVLKVQWGRYHKSKHEFASLSEPIETCLGVVRFKENIPLERGDKMRFKTLVLPVLIDVNRKAITAKQVNRGLSVVDVSTTSDCPYKAVCMINEMVSLYNEFSKEDKNITATNTKLFVEERLAVIAVELDSIERELEQYKKHNKIANISAEAELVLTGAQEYQKQKVNLTTQIGLLDYVNDILTVDKDAFSMIPANLGFTDQALVALIGSYNEMVLQRMRVQRTATGENPMLAILDEQLIIMRENIMQSIQNVKDGFLITLSQIEKEELKLSNRIEGVPKQEREYVRLERERRIKQEVYLFLCQKIEESNITLSTSMVSAKTIDKAQPSPDKVAPRLKIILFLALVMGACIPIGVLFLYSLWNNTITDSKEFEKIVKVPLIGQLTQGHPQDGSVIIDNKDTISIELFNLLRTNIGFLLSSRKENQVVLVTSSVFGEGKSYVAINLANSLAKINKKVCLVGLDVRKPMLASYLQLPSNGLLTNYLSDKSYTSSDIIYPSNIHESLDIIPAGVIPPNPSELLQNERLDNLFIELRKQYDYIIVDTAPVAIVSDTFILNRISDMTLYVSRANHTTRDLADLINGIYEHKRLKNMACVLNGVKRTDISYNYNYGG